MAYEDIRQVTFLDGKTLPVGHPEITALSFDDDDHYVAFTISRCLLSEMAGSGPLYVTVSNSLGDTVVIGLQTNDGNVVGNTYTVSATNANLYPKAVELGDSDRNKVCITFDDEFVNNIKVNIVAYATGIKLSNHNNVTNSTAKIKLQPAPNILREGVDYGTAEEMNALSPERGRIFFVKVQE